MAVDASMCSPRSGLCDARCDAPAFHDAHTRAQCVNVNGRSSDVRSTSACSDLGMLVPDRSAYAHVVVELRPERFVAGGDAIARGDDGRVVFVRGALPGEMVEADLVRKQRDWGRAEVVEVLERAPGRADPPCPRRHEGCGGCDWMHVKADAQLGFKTDIVADALRRTGKLSDPPIHTGRAVPANAYRTTIRVVAGADGRFGFRAAESHEIVPASGCLVVHPRLESAIANSSGDPGVEVTLRTSVATGEMTARWDGRAGAVHGLPHGTEVGAEAVVHEQVGSTTLRVSAGSFFQSGPAAAELLVDEVRRAAPELTSAALVVDAYAGVGLFAACAVPVDSHLIVVESSSLASADARHNLSDRDVEVHTAEVADVRLGETNPDVVIADPARSGLGKPGTRAIAETKPSVLVLVSCDPVALARDSQLLAQRGYQLDAVTVLDLFPHTHHVETVARFTPAR